MGKAAAKIAEGIKEVGVMTYKDVLQSSMQEAGKALATTFQFVFTPFTALQFVNDVVKANLQHKLQQYEERLKLIPAEQRVEVHPELGVPIIQRLSYTTNDEIANMFISLLTSASNMETLSDAHPSFISIIDRLSPDEARMLVYMQEHYVDKTDDVPYVDFHGEPIRKKKSIEVGLGKIEPLDEDMFKFYEIASWLTILPKYVKLDFPEKMHLYWANLISCGIIKDMKGYYKDAYDEEYAAIEEYHEMKKIEEECVPTKYSKVKSQRTFFEITKLGRDFIGACLGAARSEGSAE